MFPLFFISEKWLFHKRKAYFIFWRNTKNALKVTCRLNVFKDRPKGIWSRGKKMPTWTRKTFNTNQVSLYVCSPEFILLPWIPPTWFNKWIILNASWVERGEGGWYIAKGPHSQGILILILVYALLKQALGILTPHGRNNTHMKCLVILKKKEKCPGFKKPKCEGLNRTGKEGGYSTWGTSMREKREGRNPMLCSRDMRLRPI